MYTETRANVTGLINYMIDMNLSHIMIILNNRIIMQKNVYKDLNFRASLIFKYVGYGTT